MKQKQIVGLLVFTLFWGTHYGLTASEFKGHEGDPEWGITYMYDRLPKVNEGTQKRLKQLFEDTYGANWELTKDIIASKITGATTRGMAITDWSTDITNLKNNADTAETDITTAGGAEHVGVEQLLIYTNNMALHGMTGGKINLANWEIYRNNFTDRFAGYVRFYNQVVNAIETNAAIKTGAKDAWGITDYKNPTQGQIDANTGIITTKIADIGAAGWFSCSHISLKGQFGTKAGAPINAELRYEGWTGTANGFLNTDPKINAAIQNLAQGTMQAVNAAFADDATYTAGHQTWFDTHLVATPSAGTAPVAPGAPAPASTLFEALTTKITALQTTVAQHLGTYAKTATSDFPPFSKGLYDKLVYQSATSQNFVALAPVLQTNNDILQASQATIDIAGKMLNKALGITPPPLPAADTSGATTNTARIKQYFQDYWALCNNAITTMKAGGAAAAAPALQPQLTALENAMTALNGSAGELAKGTKGAPIPGTSSTVDGLGGHMATQLTAIKTALEGIYTTLGNAAEAAKVNAIVIPAP